MLLPRLLVAVQPAIFQRVGFPITTWMPSHISRQKPDSPPAVPGCGAGSGLRIPKSEAAEMAKEAASTQSDSTAPMAWIRKPASAGPASCAADLLTSSLLLPSTRSVRGISAGGQDQDRHRRQRQGGDLGPGLADRLAGPEQQEAPVAPEATAERTVEECWGRHQNGYGRMRRCVP